MSDNWQQWEDLPPEKEDELIDEIAHIIVKRRMGLIASMILESGGPLTSMFAELWMGLYGPFFDFLRVDKYMALLRNKRNVKKLIKRIDELEEEMNNKDSKS
jgi:acyl-CoA reductase-like NAD-dependent aldehyde dehydrogenase